MSTQSMFRPTELRENPAEFLKKDFPAPKVFSQVLPWGESEFHLLTGSKAGFEKALNFWISAMNYLCQLQLTQAGGHDYYLSYRDRWIRDADCKPISREYFFKTLKTYTEDSEEFNFNCEPVAQMQMRDEWDNVVMLFETENEFEIFYWETGA